MKPFLKGVLATALSVSLCVSPALAAAEEPQQLPSPWAYSAMADSYAMGLLDDNYGTYITSPLTLDQLEQITDVVSTKLAALNLPRRSPVSTVLVVDTTRGGVMNALYQECAAYVLPGVENGVVDYLSRLGVIQGDGSNLARERFCTYQEAMVMAQRLILAVYDSQDAGSKGLLWKAVNGTNTLYLLGTIHLDRDNVYPLHRSLREALLSAQTVAFELDFNDAQGMAEFVAMQSYSDGTTLADHISPDLYARVSSALTALGMQEDVFSLYKPWALASTFTVLGSTDDTTSSNAMAIDLYLNSLATWSGIPTAGVETYAFQGGIFDTLSPEYQEAYLAGALGLYEVTLDGTQVDSEVAAVAAQNDQTMQGMFAGWKTRDPEAFSASYNKEATLTSTDELSSRLFTDRDPGMIAAAAAYLEQEGTNTVFLAVGAGHMVDPGGIVSGLRALGYSVELVP